MNRRSVSISTRGRISAIKAAITTASIGWIVIVGNPSGGRRTVYIEDEGGGRKEASFRDEHLKKLIAEDEEIFTIIKIFVECQT